jgi:hypothetical protein
MNHSETEPRPADDQHWRVPTTGAAQFDWVYDAGRARLLALYQKGKDKQWDSTKRIDWDLPVDPYDVLGRPDHTVGIFGSPQWHKLGPRDRDELKQHVSAWQFSQFLHGEQGAMICSARIVETVPDLDSKFYACTQTMDEARHVEVFSRFVQDKVGLTYPISPHLKTLLDETLTRSEWDMPYLGMQVLIEGLALAAFGVLRGLTTTPLAKQVIAYVMQDEARHVAFGRMALKDCYAQLTSRERAEREDFIVEGCYLMRDRLRGREVWENLGYDVAACTDYINRSRAWQTYQSLLFSRIVPVVKDIGLWGPKVQQAYADMGVLDLAGVDVDVLMADDERIADGMDAERREFAARQAEVDEVIADGAD